MLTGDTAYDSPAGFSLGGPGADVSGNTAYDNSYGISVSGPGSTVSGNTVFDNADAGINASGSVVVSGNTVYGQTGNGTGIALSSGAQASSNVVYDNGTGIDISSGGLVSDNQVYGNAGAGIAASERGDHDPGQPRLRQRRGRGPGGLLQRDGLEQCAGREYGGGDPRPRVAVWGRAGAGEQHDRTRRPAMRCKWMGASPTRSC